MNGIVYYLDRDLRTVHGHTIYIDSPWALTSISQPQFWQARFQPERLGDGRARGILSVDVSDWEAIGSGIRKQAMFCSREEIVREVGTSSRRASTTTPCASSSAWRCWRPSSTRASFTPTRPRRRTSSRSSSTRRVLERPPEASSDRIDNLFLASDYVRTHTDLATMEGANEAARRAVNAILERSGSSAEPLPGLAAQGAAAVRALPGTRQGAVQAGPPASTANPTAAGADQGGATARTRRGVAQRFFAGRG